MTHTEKNLTGRKELMARLNALAISVTVVDHPPLFTVEESKALRGTIAGAHTKNLFVKDKKGTLFLLIAEEDATLDMKTLNKTIGCARLSFASADLLQQKLGVAPGSVTALAIINDTENEVEIILDKALMDHPIINCHPLTNEATLSISKSDLLVFIRACNHEPRILPLSQGDDA